MINTSARKRRIRLRRRRVVPGLQAERMTSQTPPHLSHNLATSTPSIGAPRRFSFKRATRDDALTTSERRGQSGRKQREPGVHVAQHGSNSRGAKGGRKAPDTESAARERPTPSRKRRRGRNRLSRLVDATRARRSIKASKPRSRPASTRIYSLQSPRSRLFTFCRSTRSTTAYSASFGTDFGRRMRNATGSA